MKTGPSNTGSAFVTSLLTSLIVSLIVCLFFNYFGADIIDKLLSQTSEVPSLAGMGLGEAKSALAAKKLTASVQGEANDAKVPKGGVISQNPSAGLKVKKDSNISVILSSGKTAVPKLALLVLADAKNKLSENGLTAGEIKEVESGQVPAGAVVSSEPEEGKEAPQGSAVALIISRGVGLVKVPRLVGRQLSAAKKALEAAGLAIGNTRETTSEFYQFGIVLEQKPDGGTQARKGSAVNITVNVEDKSQE